MKSGRPTRSTTDYSAAYQKAHAGAYGGGGSALPGQTGRTLPQQRVRRKPFGYDLVMSMSPSFVALALAIILFICWWQSVRLDGLLGRESHLRVRRVLDGDTFLANTEDGYLVKLRLRAVDAPELEQPYGTESMHALRDILFAPHTDVIGFVHEKDYEGRYIADVFTQTAVSEFRYVQSNLLRKGLAWHHGAFDKRMKLKEIMENATRDKVGIWTEKDPTPPWRFRREKEREKQKRAHQDTRTRGGAQGRERQGRPERARRDRGR
eukprot:TRINITY_DN66239_c0_g1_i1.p1 TRINITY_DN66239_c0_g1~~TRINITY_DN66239_c0_g1_i1.p1  ORF type:complete len:265 (+),score=69.42 TRINITY_DN66239_c0_g1_i1:142-936(+)